MNAVIAIEVVKALAMLAMQIMEENGLTEEQFDEAYEEAKNEFRANNPDLIPDV